MRVTVFGGSKPKPGEPAYEEALRLGRLLGRAGHTILTGGYLGTMEAVSCGAAETGAHVIGVTCDEIEAWRGVRCNPCVSEEIRLPTLRQRLLTLIDESQAALALPGGPGTLTEISMMWNQMLTRAIPARPLILIGPGWRATFDAFYSALDDFIPSEQRSYLTFADSVEQAVEQLNSLV